MIYISFQDFVEKAASLSSINRTEALICAKQMKLGDNTARERLIQGYLPFVASCVKHAPKQTQTLGLVMQCICDLEKAVDTFNFEQNNEKFEHRLSFVMRQSVVKYLVNSRAQK